MRHLSRTHHRWLIALFLLALAVRMVIPAGWMPSFADGRATITLCTSSGIVEAWLDADGNLHKDSPAKKKAGDQPCAFAGLGAAVDDPHIEGAALAAFSPQPLHHNRPASVAIGLGLAAPPPPAIGPPALI